MAKFAHRLASEHVLLTKTAAKAILKEQKCELNQLPFIYITDPAIKLLMAEGAKVVPGSVVQITRPSPVVETEVYYRVVIVPYEGLI